MKPSRNLIFTKKHKIRLLILLGKNIRLAYNMNFHNKTIVFYGSWIPINMEKMLIDLIAGLDKIHGAGTHWIEYGKNYSPCSFTVTIR